MKSISLRELHLDTGRWVHRVADGDAMIVTDRGRPIATIQPYDASVGAPSLPNREARIRKRGRVQIDSVTFQSQMRDRP